MKITILRRVDLLIGRPICWVLTIFYTIKKLFIKKGAITYPKKILIIKLFGMGSIVLAIPSINALKKKYKESSIYFLTFKGNENILTLTGIIPKQKIVTVRTDTLLHISIDVIRGLFFFLKERIDVVIDFEFFSRFTAIFSFLILSKYRIGFYGFHTEGLKRGNFIDFRLNYNHTLHTSRIFFTLLKPLGIKQPDFDSRLPQVPPSANFRTTIISMIKKENNACDVKSINKWIVINPNSSDIIDLRKWPEKHVIRLIDLLLSAYESLGVIIIGSKEEQLYTESLVKTFEKSKKESRLINLTGRTSIRQLIDVLHFADLFITTDSGPAHIASLTSTPSIVLFGPETPALYSPMGEYSRCIYLNLDCQPCVTIYNGKLSYCHDNICLQKIEPDFIFKVATEKLMRNLPTEK